VKGAAGEEDIDFVNSNIMKRSRGRPRKIITSVDVSIVVDDNGVTMLVVTTMMLL